MKKLTKENFSEDVPSGTQVNVISFKDMTNGTDSIRYEFQAIVPQPDGEHIDAVIRYDGGKRAELICRRMEDDAAGGKSEEEPEKIVFPHEVFRLYARKYFTRLSADVGTREPYQFDPGELMVHFINDIIDEEI